MAIYIKSLDIQGFKSFHTRTKIELSDGITGIVGPNGCGKSNIVESIKWVLGEQSVKSLRGNKMQDVIFGGTQHRSSAGMADVSLTFNNESNWLSVDFPEVCIGRRVFRSGENQYFINGTRSRLKDTTELFLDTGVGKDSYAIFEQGKIDRLLSESPTDRRVLFEDFSGISKIKFRKEEAQKKLDQAQDNLQRIQEILFQKEEDLKKLENQAVDAESFQYVNSKLREAELKFEATRLGKMQEEILKRSKEISSLKEQMSPLVQHIEEAEKEISFSDQEIEQTVLLFSEINKKNLSKEKELAECKIQYLSSKRMCEEKTSQKRDLELTIRQSKTRIEEWEDLLLEKNDSLMDSERALKKANSVLKTLDEQLNSLKHQLLQIEKEVMSKSGFSLSTEELKNHILSLDEKNQEFSSQISIYDSDLSRLTHEIADNKLYLADLLSQLISQETNVKILQENNIEIETKLSNENAHIQSMQTQIRALEEENSNLLKLSKNLDQEIITSIDLLLKLLESFGKSFDSQRQNLSLIYQEIATLQEKESLEKTMKNFQQILGDIDKSYNLMINGIFGKDSLFTEKINLLHRQEKISDELSPLKINLERLFVSKQEIDEAHSISLKTFIEAESTLNTLKKESTKIEILMEKLLGSQKTLMEKHKDISLEYTRNVKELKNVQSILSNCESLVSAKQLEISDLQLALSEAKINVKSSEIILKSLEKEIGSIEERKQDFLKLEEKNIAELHTCSKVIECLNEELIDLESEKDSLEYDVAKLNSQIEIQSKNIENLKNQKKLSEKNYHLMISKLNEMKIRESEIEGSISERKKILAQTKLSFQEQFQTHIDEIKLEPEETIEKLNEDIRQLRQQLSKIGNVNLLAIEQLQDSKEEFQKLSYQKNDVEKAIEDTIKLIRDTDKESSQKFLLGFQQIRDAFQKLFSELFNGGRADLIMINPNDPLGSGIDILAEPPGQKFQNINLLSGGQRAMVAISVIFAILELKPKPFVILDEIDAPLDDENIQRFKNLLTKFKKISQFVVVSHSKSTLEICDTLFGVTMEELGCSKILSVAFDEKENLLFV